MDMRKPEKSIEILEKPNVISAWGHTSHRTWEAGLHLACHLKDLEISRHIIGKRVLELGSGTGLLSLLCVSMGAEHVLSTDGDDEALTRQRKSIQRNASDLPRATSVIDVQRLMWGSTINSLLSREQSAMKTCFDTLLATDLTYEPRVIPDLLKTLKDVLNVSPSVTVIMSITIRQESSFEYFKQMCCMGPLRLLL